MVKQSIFILTNYLLITIETCFGTRFGQFSFKKLAQYVDLWLDQEVRLVLSRSPAIKLYISTFKLWILMYQPFKEELTRSRFYIYIQWRKVKAMIALIRPLN